MPATNSWKGTGPSKIHTLAMFRGSSFRSRYRKAASMADMLDAPAGFLLMTRPRGLRKQITVANTTGTPKAEREAVIRITPPGDERPLFVNGSARRAASKESYKRPHRHVLPVGDLQ